MSKYQRLRITYKGCQPVYGDHLATIPKDSSVTTAELRIFYGLNPGDVGWLEQRYNILDQDRYLVKISGDAQIVVVVDKTHVEVEKIDGLE